MADSTAVAIAGVTAGAAVAIASPLITWRATKAGQQRLFRHQSRLADRQELRVLLDEAVEAMNKVERALRKLVAAYGESEGPEELRAAKSLARSAKAIHRLESVGVRLAIRLEQPDELTESCREACAHGLAVLGAVNRHAVLPSVTDPPRFQFLADELAALEREAERFAALAQRRFGAFVIDDE
jgi:hypothetical protein